ncbi:hypothetical protein [Paenibacillus eucommiae]|uniref:Endolytic transglycosylase MltG n=1 Tax=Paenibacillus eucommiae TaxID=1355755 RepID=A0ABS4IUR7_9BACL|nr:hypothetical protein [Paenibacillus eucommiae]MBP1991308.1 hypothetical protein [Paenibacillus eucommiae]
MLRNKSYLYGMGVGLIVGATLLQLMAYSINVTSQTTKPAAISEWDPISLKAEASKSFQVFEKGEKVYTQAELDRELQKKLKEEKDKLAVGSPAPSSAAKSTILYIQPDLVASNVSELLYKAGIVKDRSALEKELVKQNATRKMQVGFHRFEGELDIQQIIDILTSDQ